jgi:hypothetical protein
VIDLKQLYKNAEFVGKIVNRAIYRGKLQTWQGYQQSCPQFLGVKASAYKNQGLSAVFGSNSCSLCAGAHKTIARQPTHMPRP